MNERSERIVAGLSGIAFVVLSAVVAALPPFPAVGASAQAVVAYYGAHQRAFLVLNFLGVAGLVPGLVVLAYLTAVFRRAEREGGWLWILTLAGGLFAFIAAWVDLALFQCAAYAAVRGDERIARALGRRDPHLRHLLPRAVRFLRCIRMGGAGFAHLAGLGRRHQRLGGAPLARRELGRGGHGRRPGRRRTGDARCFSRHRALVLGVLDSHPRARAPRSARLVTSGTTHARMSTSPGRNYASSWLQMSSARTV